MVESRTPETVAHYVDTLSLVPISTVVFTTFSCSGFRFKLEGREFRIENRLCADLRLDCDSPEHAFFEACAAVMMFLYPVGVPLLGMALLYQNRCSVVAFLEKCEDDENDTTKVWTRLDPTSDIELIKSLYAYYKADYFWWDVVDIVVGLLLTGFAVVFEPGSMMQIVWAVCVSFACNYFQNWWQPYRDSCRNFMTGFVNLQILVTLFASLLIKIDNEAGGSFSYEAGCDLRTVGTVLIM